MPKSVIKHPDQIRTWMYRDRNRDGLSEQAIRADKKDQMIRAEALLDSFKNLDIVILIGGHLNGHRQDSVPNRKKFVPMLLLRWQKDVLIFVPRLGRQGRLRRVKSPDRTCPQQRDRQSRKPTRTADSEETHRRQADLSTPP